MRVARWYRGPTALFAMAAVASYNPVMTAMESSSTTTATSSASDTDGSAKSTTQALKHGKSHIQCTSYGCPLYPQDVYYDATVKESLASLRMYKRDQVMDRSDDDNSSSSITGTSDEDASTTTSTTQDSQDTTTTTISSSAEPLAPLEFSGNKYAGTLTLIGYKGGPLEAQINQDRAFCVAPYHWNEKQQQKEQREQQESHELLAQGYPHDRQLLGVFDGHANLGEKVSQYTVTELPKLLATKLKEQQNRRSSTSSSDKKDDEQQQKIQQALIETFVEIDKKAPAELSGGCTASVVYQDGPSIYIANAGDSRSFVAVYRAQSQTVSIVYISREDKPELPDERARVEQMGGQVYLPLRGTSRVLYMDPETGTQSGLAMSRSIGDWEAGKLGVIPHPIVDVVNIPELVEEQLTSAGDHCMVITMDPMDTTTISPECLESSDIDDVYVFAVSATDGLMDFATPELVAQTVATSLFAQDGPHLLTALEQLIYMAAQGWDQAKQGRYRDDIALVVAQLRIPPQTTTTLKAEGTAATQTKNR
jgi:serine/threonine protein phosphatase PrpC